jgi:hypothetical protein
VHSLSGHRLQDWSEVGSLEIKPQKGADLTRVIFADFQWVKAKPAP